MKLKFECVPFVDKINLLNWNFLRTKIFAANKNHGKKKY